MRFNATATKQLSATTETYTSQIVIKLLFVVSATSINVTDVSVVLVGCVTGCERLNEFRDPSKLDPQDKRSPAKCLHLGHQQPYLPFLEEVSP